MSLETIKVVLVGESGTGKTSIIQQFAYKMFDENCTTSISSQYISKVIGFPEIKKSLKIEIWDTAGQERYRSMVKLFYKDAKIIIFIYDCTSKSSFEELKNYWIPEIQNSSEGGGWVLAIVANKSDLYEREAISQEEGMKLADSINAIFQVTSAKSGSGVDKLFKNLGRLYLDPEFDYKAADKIDEENYRNKKLLEEKKKDEQIDESNQSVKITKKVNNKRRGCCG